MKPKNNTVKPTVTPPPNFNACSNPSPPRCSVIGVDINPSKYSLEPTSTTLFFFLPSSPPSFGIRFSFNLDIFWDGDDSDDVITDGGDDVNATTKQLFKRMKTTTTIAVVRDQAVAIAIVAKGSIQELAQT